MNQSDKDAAIIQYITDLFYVMNIPRWVVPIFKEFAQTANPMGNIIVNTGSKRMIAKRLGRRSHSGVDRAMDYLVKYQILVRIERGVYILNSQIVGSTNLQDVTQMNINLKYTSRGRTFRTKVNNPS